MLVNNSPGVHLKKAKVEICPDVLGCKFLTDSLPEQHNAIIPRIKLQHFGFVDIYCNSGRLSLNNLNSIFHDAVVILPISANAFR